MGMGDLMLFLCTFYLMHTWAFVNLHEPIPCNLLNSRMTVLQMNGNNKDTLRILTFQIGVLCKLQELYKAGFSSVLSYFIKIHFQRTKVYYDT
jgi:hypothetical protein